MPRGSSPLARGKGEGRRACDHEPGIIPACAGKRRIKASKSSATRDHPRLRGEKCLRHWARSRAIGSSPLARGKVAEIGAQVRADRIIPACAGKSDLELFVARFMEDHPRLRGEKGHGDLAQVIRAGSSPLARGKAYRGLGARGDARIIPACAGKRTGAVPPPRSSKDHPRLRGEKYPEVRT